MKRIIDIVYGVAGQSLFWDAPEGRPSSIVSSAVFPASSGDDDTAESALTGSAAVETTPNTTFDAASGDGQTNPRKCNLTATTGAAVGRSYLLTNAAGEREWAEVREIAAADHVVARHPLANAYASADTFQSTRVSHALESAWVADETNLSDDSDPNPGWRWRLVYVVAGVTYVHDLYFDLTRYAGQHAVTGPDVDRLLPGFLDRLPTDYRQDQGAALIAEAYGEVEIDLMAAGIPDELVASPVRDRMVRRKAVQLDAEAKFNAAPTPENEARMVLAQKTYAALLEQQVTVGARAQQRDNSGAAHKPATGNLWRR